MSLEKALEKFRDYVAAFETPQGKKVKDDLSRFCLYNSSTLVTVDSKVDPFRMAMQEGKRQVYLYILSCLEEPTMPKEVKEEDDPYAVDR